MYICQYAESSYETITRTLKQTQLRQLIHKSFYKFYLINCRDLNLQQFYDFMMIVLIFEVTEYVFSSFS